MQHRRRRQVARQQARRVRQDGARLDHVQAEEGDRPHAVEYLQEEEENGGLLETVTKTHLVHDLTYISVP